MKKLLALFTVILGLVSPSALTADAETAPTLWPACDPATGLWGYITADGAWGIAPQYTGAGHFHDGCAIVSVGEPEDPALYYLEDAGIIDETGAFLLEPEYRIYDFCDENAGDIYFVDGEGPDEEYLWALMSREGEMLTEPRWEWVNHRVGEPWLAVCEDGKWSYLDAYGQEMFTINGEIAWAETFRGALAFIRFDKETQGYVNRAGEIVCQWPVEE